MSARIVAIPSGDSTSISRADHRCWPPG